MVASAASTSNKMSSESEMLPRFNRMVTGVAAERDGRARPAPVPATARTAR